MGGCFLGRTWRYLLASLVVLVTVHNHTAIACENLLGCSPEPTPTSQPQGSEQPSEPAPTQGSPEVPEPIASLESRMMQRINDERSSAGLSSLSHQPWAHTVSQEHSGRMATSGTIWHNDVYFRDGKREMGANFKGENVVMAESVDEAHLLLMNSPPHRQNILDGRFTHFGVGIARDTNGKIFVTEAFARIPEPRLPDSKRKVAALQAAPLTPVTPTHQSGSSIPIVAHVPETIPVLPDAIPEAHPSPEMFLGETGSNRSDRLNFLALILWMIAAGGLVVVRTRRGRESLSQMIERTRRVELLLADSPV